MSSTEIFGFDKIGNAYKAGEVKNAYRGVVAIWRILEEKYLPPYRPSYVPEWVSDDEVENFLHYKPSRCLVIMEENAVQEIWNLVDNKNVSEIDKICLLTTFDRCLVKKENLEKVIRAFNEFEGETSLKEQALILQEMLKDENCIAVGWNQTSVNSSIWGNYSHDEENDIIIPYNCLKQGEHYWLFDELK